MKREPWRMTGLPYWKGIYSASYPSGTVKYEPMNSVPLVCGVNSSNATTAAFAVNTTTSTMVISLRVSGLALDSVDAAHEMLDGLAISLRQQWIGNAFRVLITSIQMLGVTPDEHTINESTGFGDVLVDVLVEVSPGKASEAARFCSITLQRVQIDFQTQGMTCYSLANTVFCSFQVELVCIAENFSSAILQIRSVTDARDVSPPRPPFPPQPPPPQPPSPPAFKPLAIPGTVASPTSINQKDIPLGICDLCCGLLLEVYVACQRNSGLKLKHTVIACVYKHL